MKAGAFGQTLKGINPGLEVIEEAWPEFVAAVEKGEFNSGMEGTN